MHLLVEAEFAPIIGTNLKDILFKLVFDGPLEVAQLCINVFVHLVQFGLQSDNREYIIRG